MRELAETLFALASLLTSKMMLNFFHFVFLAKLQWLVIEMKISFTLFGLIGHFLYTIMAESVL